MRTLERLLAPKSIAIVGGGAWGASIVGAANRMGFAGAIYLVHPNGKQVAGAQTVTSLLQIPGQIDAAFVAVNRHASIQIVQDLAKLKCGGAVCFASGFAEAKDEDQAGVDLQAKLVDAAADMPILGPNCYGFINALDRTAIWPDQHGMAPVERGVAILTQSSNIAINLTQQARGLPIGYMVTCGNQAQTSQADLAFALLDDPRVTAVGLHIEGFEDIAAWDCVARKAHAQGTPIVALKVGRSEQAQRATISHTASLAGSDAGARALMAHWGFGQVDDLPCLLEALKLLHVFGRLDNATLSSISCSGGEASLAADLALGYNLSFPALTEDQRVSLRDALGPMVALANPLDYHTYIWRDAAAMTAAWAPMAAPHVGLTFSIVDYPRTDAADWECATQAALAVRQKTNRPFAVVATLPELMPADTSTRLMEGEVAPMCGLRELMVAAELAAGPVQIEPDAPLSASSAPEMPVLIDEHTAKHELSAYGIAVPAAVQIARDGPCVPITLTAPFAVKGVGLAHKTDAGAVKLHVTAEALFSVLSSMPTPDVLVEEMVQDCVVELLVGVRRDPAHGFVLTLGAGGVLTEVLKDTASLIVPTSPDGVRAALMSLKIAPLLHGYRGKPAANLDAVVVAVMAVQRYVVDHCDGLDEIEINPLVATPDRAVAVDALIRRTAR